MEIRGRAPLRISLTGGGTDLNYVFEKIGGAVTNFTINKYCHMTLKKRDDGEIFVNGNIIVPDGHDEPLVRILIDKKKPPFGFDLFYYNDIEPRSGLGSSSSFNVLILRMLAEMEHRTPPDIDIIREAYEIDTTLKEGGWQDQYAASIGGFNFMEFGQQTTVYPLRLRYRTLCELIEHLTLIKIGDKPEQDTHKLIRTHNDKNLNDARRIKEMEKLKELAYLTRNALLNDNVRLIGAYLHDNWTIKRNPITTTSEIDELYRQALAAGATGGKLCGSGRGGHFLLFAPPERKPGLLEKLKEYNVIPFDFTEHGVETWQP